MSYKPPFTRKRVLGRHAAQHRPPTTPEPAPEPPPPAKPDWNSKMLKRELLEIAVGPGYELDVSDDNTKVEIIAALEAADK